MSRSATPLLLALLLPAAVEAAGPGKLVSIDPLAEPAPAVAGTLRYQTAEIAPEAKLAPALREEIRGLEGSERLEVVVSLGAPLLPKGGPAAADLERERVRRIARLEHDFAGRARERAGFEATRGLSRFPVVIGSVPASRLAALASLPEVRAIERVVPIFTTRVEGGALIRAPQLREQLGGTGAGVGVAIVDTGIDGDLAEFRGRIVAEGDFTHTTGEGTIDDVGHGTPVAGIVAGASAGMAPRASLWAVKTFRAGGPSTLADLLAALDSLYAQRGEFGGLDVVNLSLSVGGATFESFRSCEAAYPALAALLQELARVGVVTVAASGNDGVKSGVSAPACLPSTIAIGAVYDANLGAATYSSCGDATTRPGQPTCYSNAGLLLDAFAPSHCARTPAAGGGTYDCFGGTSAAAPYAAGVAAQILSLRPETTPDEMLGALSATGTPTRDGGTLRNRIDAVAAYQRLAGSGSGGDIGTSPCVPGEHTLCAVGGRFEIVAQAPRSLFPGKAGRVSPVIAADLGGAFHFFANEENFHVVVKIALRPSGYYAVSAVALDGLEWTVTIRDTFTGQVKSYDNAAGGPGAPTDGQAFPKDP